jgi:preprotein translocase subunit SecE
MAMNREQKRMLQRQGALGADGAPAPQARKAPPAPKPKPSEKRLPPIKWARQYLREVMAELRKVSFPTRPEVANYSVIVFALIVVLTISIGLLDLGLSHLVLKVFSR